MTSKTSSPNPNFNVDASINRRTIVKTAAWAAPVVALAVSAPSAAASVVAPKYDLTVQSFQFNEAANWDNDTASALYGLGYVTWSVRLCNNGPDEAPAGATLSIGMGMGPYFDDFQIVDPGGLSLSEIQRIEAPTDYANDAYYRTFWEHSVNIPIPAGVCYTVQVKARLRRTPIAGYPLVQDASNAASLSKSYNIFTIVRVVPADSNDISAVNNNDASDNIRSIRVHTNANNVSTAVPGTYTPLPQS